MRKINFVTGELYHIMNRGVDKRIIFDNKEDVERFFLCLNELNTSNVTFGIKEIKRNNKFQHSVLEKIKDDDDKLVDFIGYNVLPNHFHFILRQRSEAGISKFLHKIQMAYTKYYNAKNTRSGGLFQGAFRAEHVDSNEYLLHLSAYVNLNHLLHVKFQHSVLETSSSIGQYIGDSNGIIKCDTGIILDQFESKNGYEKFMMDTLEDIRKRKVMLKELENDDINLINS